MRFVRVDTADRATRLPLIGMIDVFFLLLVYFLTSATITPPEEELAASLSAEKEDAAAASLEPQVVTVGAPAAGVGRFTVSGVSLGTQAELVSLLSSLPKEPGVFIRANDDARVDDVAAALQASRDAGFERITYVAPE